MKKRILTVSSANMDFVMKVARVPEAGQTLLDDGSFRFVPGGKGANAAVAIQRLGGDSVFCTRLGNDRNGDELRRIYAREGVDCRFIVTDPERATGLASIMVEPSGQNRIIVFPGANAAICSDDVESAMLCRPDALFMQLEIAADAIIYAAGRLSGFGAFLFRGSLVLRSDEIIERHAEQVGDRRQRSYLRHRFSALPFRHSLIRIMQLLREVELRHPF